MFGHFSEKMEDIIGTIEAVDELVSFAWSIDWSLCQRKTFGELIQSPSFSTLSDNGKILEWRLQLYPNGINRKCRGNLSLYLRTTEREKKPNLQQKVVHFHLINNQKEVINKVCGEVFSQIHRDTCGLDRFIPKDLFGNNCKDLLNYGKLTIVCTIADIKTERNFNSSVKPESPMMPRPLPRYKSLGDLTRTYDGEEKEEEEERVNEPPRNLFEMMLESGKSDVTINAAGKTFCAHRAILSARSSFFRSLFEQDIAQRKRVSFVDMNDLIAVVVIELLRYLYLNRVDKLEERASLLLAPANKYQLEKLKEQCEMIMIKDLNIANASEYLALSFVYEASKIQEKAMEFVVDHSLDVVNTPGFKAIAGSHANVIAAILKTITVRGKMQGASQDAVKEELEESTWIRKKKCNGKLCEDTKKFWENNN